MPNLGDEYRTISMWIRPYDISWNHKIFYFKDETYWFKFKHHGGISFDRNIGGLKNSFYDATAEEPLLQSNVWQHLTLRWDSSQARYDLILDGVVKYLTSTTGFTPLLADANVFFPAFSGKLDDLRFYSRSLSEAEIRALCDQDGDGLNDVREAELGTNPNLADTDGDGDPDHNETAAGSSPTNPNETIMSNALATGLQVHLKFDETNGTTAYDSSGNNRYATLQGVDGNGSTWINGKIGGALNFDGVNDWGSVPTILDYDYSVAFWIKTTNSDYNGTDSFDAPNGILVAEGSTTGIFHNGGKIDLKVGEAAFKARMTSQVGVNQDIWFHVVCVCNKTGNWETNFQIFINGIQDKSSNNNKHSTTSGPLNLGRNTQVGGKHFEGALDDLRIYDRVLTTGEIQTLYDLGQ